VRPISLTELARAGAVSKEHLARLFRRRYGVSPGSALELAHVTVWQLQILILLVRRLGGSLKPVAGVVPTSHRWRWVA
jgi:AraC-like DNA-binding protein